MKIKFFLLLLGIILISSCSYKVTRTYTEPIANATLLENCTPYLMKKRDMYGLNYQFLGSMKFQGEDLSKYCSEDEIVPFLKREACYLQANFINITDELFPTFLNGIECYQCIANFYTIDINQTTADILNKKERFIIKWEKTPNLNWNDFRISLPETDSVPYIFVSNIYLQSGISVWTGVYKDFHAQGSFYGDVSKMKPSFKTEKNKTHIDMLYNLSQIYAKRLEKAIEKERINPKNKGRIQEILDSFVDNLQKQQIIYSTATEYGQNESMQQAWNEKIQEIMAELEISKNSL